MSKFQLDKIGLRVGLEIHQQLSTGRKLFCNCTSQELDEYSAKITRKLRAQKSELGEYDPAALFENTKSQTMVYFVNPESSCLVEQDEEPPHELNLEAKKLALIIASALNSTIFKEIFVMRKMVIDGSNTSGFQRTMLVSHGGHVNFGEKKVGVQSICLEEDAAKLLDENERERSFSLDRLGIPLVEIALEPVSGPPDEIRKIALELGKMLRATRRVVRGLGSIRQDVNVSINGGGVVEIKGVQQLDQLEKVILYEAKRQHGLSLIAGKLTELDIEKISQKDDVFNVTEILRDCKSKIIQKAIKQDSIIKVIRIKNFLGMFSYSPHEDIRLGKELGQLVRFFGIGGIFHSDELPNYGVEISDVENIQKFTNSNKNDGFLIIAGQSSKINFAINSIIKRIENAKLGIPAETRAATLTGETVYLRPRPGASRMYPETDIPPIRVSDKEIDIARKGIPKPWDQSVTDLQKKYNLNAQLAEQIFDSEYFELFEKICIDKKISPNFVASALCSTIRSLERNELNPILLKPEEIIKTFQMLSAKEITKESIEIIFEKIMSGKTQTAMEAIQISSMSTMNEESLDRALEMIVNENLDLIKNQGKRSMGPLMGLVMKKLRGSASGEKVNQLLQKKIQEILNGK